MTGKLNKQQKSLRHTILSYDKTPMSHYFNIQSCNSKEEYSLKIETGTCGCRFKTRSGMNKAELCSHSMAALKHLLEKNGMEVKEKTDELL